MIILVGAGNMGLAMLSRWLELGREVMVVEPSPSADLLALRREYRFTITASLDEIAEAPEAPEAIVLAVKPDQLAAVLSQIAPFLSSSPLLISPLLISIAAGVETSAIIAASGRDDIGVARAMPNISARIGQGFTSLYFNEGCPLPRRQFAEMLMSELGATAILEDEALMDAATVLSGCGPAYLFYLAELLGEAGEAIGLDADWSARAVEATLPGAAALLRQEKDAAGLRKKVTSPKGVTEAGFDILLADDQLRKIFIEAFKAAHKRARELRSRTWKGSGLKK